MVNIGSGRAYTYTPRNQCFIELRHSMGEKKGIEIPYHQQFTRTPLDINRTDEVNMATMHYGRCTAVPSEFQHQHIYQVVLRWSYIFTRHETYRCKFFSHQGDRAIVTFFSCPRVSVVCFRSSHLSTRRVVYQGADSF